MSGSSPPSPLYSVEVSFSGIQQPVYNPHSVSVIQKEYAHDMAQITIWADNVNTAGYLAGMPMQMSYGRPGATRLFYGYVHSASRSNTKINPVSMVDANSTTITCVGSSWPLKQTGTQVWVNRTIPQVIEAVGALFGLAVVAEPHPTVWPTLPMLGLSYWSFCCSLAQRIGYTFYANGVELVLKKRNTNPANLTGYVASFDQQANPAAIPSFTPVLGTTSAPGGQLVNRQMASINPRTGQMSAVTLNGSPALHLLGARRASPRFTQVLHGTAHTSQEASTKVDGEGLLNQLYITASATVSGDAQIAQGSLVYISNVNGSQNGLWYVEQAQHVFDVSTYTLSLSLGRDSLGATPSLATPPVVVSLPKASLSNTGTWVAA